MNDLFLQKFYDHDTHAEGPAVCRAECAGRNADCFAVSGFVARATDSAQDGNGNAKPNETIVFHESRVTWGPPVSANGTIRGRVTDTNGDPLIGATIQSGTRGALTNANGEYTLIDVPPGSHPVTVSYTGFVCPQKTAIVTAGNTTVVDFTCAEDFVIALEGTYRHFVGFSEVCMRVRTTPARPGASYQAQVTGPSGGVQGSGAFNGSLDLFGEAVLRNNISLFGSYSWQVNVLGKIATTSTVVTAAAGTCN